MKDFRTFGAPEKIENLEKIPLTAVRGHRPRPLDDGSRGDNAAGEYQASGRHATSISTLSIPRSGKFRLRLPRVLLRVCPALCLRSGQGLNN